MRAFLRTVTCIPCKSLSICYYILIQYHNMGKRYLVIVCSVHMYQGLADINCMGAVKSMFLDELSRISVRDCLLYFCPVFCEPELSKLFQGYHLENLFLLSLLFFSKGIIRRTCFSCLFCTSICNTNITVRKKTLFLRKKTFYFYSILYNRREIINNVQPK